MSTRTTSPNYDQIYRPETLRRAWRLVQQGGSAGGVDRVQLAEVVRTCRRHRSLSAAGRELFAASRERRASTNDTDRLRKYLARFELSFAMIKE